MASLAGVPFTAGFFGKFFIFDAAIRHHQTALVVVGVITVACGFYYYLKVVRAMYWEDRNEQRTDSVKQAFARDDDAPDGRQSFAWAFIPQPILNALDQSATDGRWDCRRLSRSARRSSRRDRRNAASFRAAARKT